MSPGNKFLATAMILLTLAITYSAAPVTSVLLGLGLLAAAYFAVRSSKL